MRRYLVAVVLAVLVPAIGHAASVDERQAVVKVVTDAYINGVHVSPDAAAMRRGFHPDFRMLVLSDGAMTAVPLEEWIARIEKSTGSGNRPKVTCEMPVVSVEGLAASVRVEIYRDGRHTFTDFLSLYRFADGWKIVGKTFHTHRRP